MKLADGKQQGKAALETDWWNPASTMASFASILPMTPMTPMLPGRNWKESPLGRDIQQYAPWVTLEQHDWESGRDDFSKCFFLKI
jgi:hypothetical protein